MRDDDAPMLLLAFSLALSAAALPSGTVVAGVSTHDGTRTDVTAFMPDGSARVLFVEEHAAGFVPKGSLDPNASKLAMAVQHDGADGATVVLRDLVSGARVVAGERAIASQAPRIVGEHVTWVRGAETPARSTFDVVSDEEVLASIDGAWLTPLHGAGDARFLHITTDGVHRVVALRGTSLDVERVLGKGPMRLPALTNDGVVVIERALGNGRARLERAGATLREGIAGMDPLVVDGARDVVVAGAGTKRAAIVIMGKASERVIDLGRAGVATPVSAALIDGTVVIVARVDRGRSLPPETWLVDGRGPRALASGGSIEVYGVVGGAP